MRNTSGKLKTLVGLLVIVFATSTVCGQSKASKNEVLKTMRTATDFLMNEVSYKGGFVWNYLPDPSRRYEKCPPMSVSDETGMPQYITVMSMILQLIPMKTR